MALALELDMVLVITILCSLTYLLYMVRSNISRNKPKVEFDEVCEICDSNLGQRYCVQCNQVMCYLCERFHGKFKISKYHSTISSTSLNIDRELTNINNFYKDLAFERTLVLCEFNPGANYFKERRKTMREWESPPRPIYFGAVHSQHGFSLLARRLECVDNTIHGYLTCTVNTSDTVNCQIDEKLLLHNETSYVTSDIHSNNIWISTGSSNVYRLNMKSKKLSMPIMAHNQVLYFGLAMLDRCLAISVTYNTIFESRAWLIQLFTRCGKLKRQIICKDLFQKPEYLASNAEEDILYISDGVANAVHAMNPRGCVLFTFTSDTMYAPRGLSVDLDGHIYVACDQGVIQIHKDCGKNRMLLRLLDNQTGIETVFFDRKLNCIVIFGKNCSQASVFKFADQLKKQELEE